MWDALRWGLSKGFNPLFTRVLEKNTENSEWLGEELRLGIEPGTSHLPAFSAEPLGQWWCIFCIQAYTKESQYIMVNG